MTKTNSSQAGRKRWEIEWRGKKDKGKEEGRMDGEGGR